MRTDSPRSRRALVACAALSAAVLATVTASAASAAGTSTSTAGPTVVTNVADKPEHTEPPKGGTAFAVAYKPTANAPDDVNAANKRFAACMREQGQDVFPYFHASKDEEGRVRLQVRMHAAKGFDPTSDAYQDALDTCVPILEKVGITFPDPADLPPLPSLPGLPGHPGKGDGPTLHTEKPTGPDEPSLGSSVETA